MSLASVLQDTKARLDALLVYANETTGQSDVSIGDAIRTLTDGFGGGGSSWIDEYKVATVVVDTDYGNLNVFYPEVVEAILKDGTTTQFDTAWYWIINVENPVDAYIGGYKTNGFGNILINSGVLANVTLPYVRNNTAKTVGMYGVSIQYENTSLLASRQIGISAGSTVTFYKLPLNR